MKRYKKNFIVIILSVIIFVAFSVLISYLIEPSLYKFYKDIEIVKEDRVLILAPHPDDESICCGGIIQKAIREEAKLKVAFLTNGDYNQLAYLLYFKKPEIYKKSYISLGQTRMGESLKSNQILGADKDDVIFLGYPDNGTLSIMTSYWDTKVPFTSILTREGKVPYKESYTPGAPYVSESILSNIEEIIKDFNPTKIFVSSPVDLNNDHRALYLFLQVALWDLKDKIEMPKVFTYLVHARGWPKISGYNPSKEISHPDFLDGDDLEWYKVDLTEEEILIKYKAISAYKSQIVYKPGFLGSFARENEIFSKFTEINLGDFGSEDIEWHKSDIFRDGAVFLESDNFKDIYYALNNKNILVKISLKDLDAKNITGWVYFLGYKKDKDFSSMPKINVNIGRTSFKVFDKIKLLVNSGVELTYKGNDLIIKVPLSVLHYPTNILSGFETKEPDKNGYLSNGYVWRVINLEY